LKYTPEHKRSRAAIYIVYISTFLCLYAKGTPRKEGENRPRGKGTISITWFHGVVTRVVGPAELVGSALVRGRAGGTLASGIGDNSVGREARYYTHTMEGYVYA